MNQGRQVSSLKKGTGLFVIGLIFFLFPFTAHAMSSQLPEDDQWLKLANQIVKQVEAEQLLEARDTLAQLAKTFSSSNFAQRKMRVEQIHALSGTILDLERKLNRVTPNLTEIKDSATRLQLAFDAVTHPNQPLWKQYDEQLLRDARQLKEAVQFRNFQRLQLAKEQLGRDYWLIRPAIVVSKSPATVERLDSLITFLLQQTSWKALLPATNDLDQVLQNLFYGQDQDVFAWVRIWENQHMFTFFVISGIISAVLAYVSWRKYQGRMMA
jgi:sporulation protein YpjB